MEKKARVGGLIFLLCSVIIILLCLLPKIHPARPVPQSHEEVPQSHQDMPPVKLLVTVNHVEINNDIVKIMLSNPAGLITGVGYKGVDNILEIRNKEGRRGYWDIVWSRPDRNDGSHFDTLDCTSFRVLKETDDQVEVSFLKTWNASTDDQQVPLNVDRRFIIMRGASGFYSYSIFEHLEGWPDLNIDEARIAFKLRQDMFDYMVISDDKQRIMPSQLDRQEGHKLDYPEAVLLTNPSNPKLGEEVDDKYQYSIDNKDNHVHGWISSDDPRIGFLVTMPSDEFRSGGPIKQDLTSHAGTTALSMFFSGHYAGSDFGVRLRNGEAWKKVYGPVFIHLNSGSTNSSSAMWADAKRKTVEETKMWPYDFPMSPDFPKANQRGAITGRLLVNDSHLTAANQAYVGLAAPGDVGSWQRDTKGYQFWTKTDESGHFTIKGVRASTYNLYAWVPGIIGDFKHQTEIVITPENEIQIGQVVYEPPRNGPTLWEIGIPDRTATEFFVPDPSHGLANRLFINHTEKYRQYGLWSRYTDYYPNQDLVYTVGVSHYSKDWFFAHVNRHVDKSYVPTTWKIVFDVVNLLKEGTYTLRVALAAVNFAELQVYINNENNRRRPLFSTGRIGKDNVIARHGIHGLYNLYNLDIPGSQLVEGRNTIHLRQSRGAYPFIGVMYDYIRLEMPPTRSST